MTPEPAYNDPLIYPHSVKFRLASTSEDMKAWLKVNCVGQYDLRLLKASKKWRDDIPRHWFRIAFEEVEDAVLCKLRWSNTV